MLRAARPPSRCSTSRIAAVPRSVPKAAINLASRAARRYSSVTNQRFSPVKFNQAVKQANKLLNSKISRAIFSPENLRVVPKRGYAKDIEYPDWEQYETITKYEYRGEMHEEHQFWDPDSIVPDWDDNISLAEVGYGLFCIAAALFVLFLFGHISSIYTPDPNMLESNLAPFGRHWVERGFSPAELPPMPAGRNERLEAHNIYTLPNALEAIEDRPGVKKY